MVKPIPRDGVTTWSRTVEMIRALPIPPDVDHPPSDKSIAGDANPTIIERIPFPKRIIFLKDRELFIQGDMCIHDLFPQIGKPFPLSDAIRRKTGWRIGKIPQGII